MYGFVYYFVVISGALAISLLFAWLINELDDVQVARQRRHRRRIRKMIAASGMSEDDLFEEVRRQVAESILIDKYHTAAETANGEVC